MKWAFWKRKRRPRVAMVKLSGVIAAKSGSAFSPAGLSLDAVQPVLEKAFAAKKCEAVVLVINSPGGSPVQSSLIGAEIRYLAQKHQREVLAYVEDVGASGGYWLACAADQIYADASSIVGSIGVISASFGFPEAMKRYGVERRVYTAGDEKMLLDPFSEESEAGKARLQHIQKQIHAQFVAWVRERRGDRLTETEKTFSGRVWAGHEAHQEGMIDGVGTLGQIMRNRYGKDVRVLPFSRRKRGFGLSLFGASVDSWLDDVLDRLEERLTTRIWR